MYRGKYQNATEEFLAGDFGLKADKYTQDTLDRLAIQIDEARRAAIGEATAAEKEIARLKANLFNHESNTFKVDDRRALSFADLNRTVSKLKRLQGAFYSYIETGIHPKAVEAFQHCLEMADFNSL